MADSNAGSSEEEEAEADKAVEEAKEGGRRHLRRLLKNVFGVEDGDCRLWSTIEF